MLAAGIIRWFSVNSGKALDVSDSSTTDGGNTQIWAAVGAANQQWRIENLGDGYLPSVESPTPAKHSMSQVGQA